MLCEAHAVAHEMVERGRSRGTVVEASEVAVAHVVGEDEDDVRPGGHKKCLDRIGITKGLMSAARFSETGTGFAGAKLSEILPAARDARFVRMTTAAARGSLGQDNDFCRSL